MREIFSGERNPACRRARGRNLYFRNVMRCRCKIWNINASRHSHNRPRTNQTVRSVLFYFNAFLSFVEWYLRRFHQNFLSLAFSFSLSLSLSPPFLPLPLSLSPLPISFSFICTPIQNGSRERNRCYYNAATFVPITRSWSLAKFQYITQCLNELKPGGMNCQEGGNCVPT